MFTGSKKCLLSVKCLLAVVIMFRTFFLLWRFEKAVSFLEFSALKLKFFFLNWSEICATLKWIYMRICVIFENIRVIFEIEGILYSFLDYQLLFNLYYLKNFMFIVVITQQSTTNQNLTILLFLKIWLFWFSMAQDYNKTHSFMFLILKN